jgi:hypothetical protein
MAWFNSSAYLALARLIIQDLFRDKLIVGCAMLRIPDEKD